MQIHSGKNPLSIKSGNRARRKHEFQMELPKSKIFAQERGEHISQAIWSSFESTVLHEVRQHENDSKTVAKLYNDIVYYSTSSYSVAALPSDVVFRKKSIGEITSKINYTEQHTVTHHLSKEREKVVDDNDTQ